MVSEHSKDVENRIDIVVNRFRTNAGPEFYTYKLKYIDNLDNIRFFWIAYYLTLSYISINLIFTERNLLAGSLVTLYMFITPVARYFARGRILKEKSWANDYISDEDILYLCENGMLKNKLCDLLKEGHTLTYSELYSEKDSYIELAMRGESRKNRDKLLSKIQQMENHKETTDTERT